MSEDDQWSPECLMTSKPVRDPYSTGDELVRGKKETNHDKKRGTSNCDTTLTLNTLQCSFNLNLINKPASIHSKYCEADIPALLGKLLQFYSGSEDDILTADMIIDSVLISPRSEVIKTMYSNKHYALDLDKSSKSKHFRNDKNLNPNTCKSIVDLQVREFLMSVSDVLAMTVNVCVDESDLWRDCMDKLGSVLGECHTQVGSTTIEMSSGDVFVSSPQVVLGHKSKKTGPTIPIQICQKDAMSSSLPKETVEIPGCVHENVASLNIKDTGYKHNNVDTGPYIKKPVTDSLCTNCFNNTALSQHILQIILAGVNFSLLSYSNDREPKSSYIGLHLCNGCVRFTKVTSRQESFRFYAISPSFRDTCCHGDMTVEFLPLVLDIFKHTHRMALLIFLKYYLQNWTSMNSTSVLS